MSYLDLLFHNFQWYRKLKGGIWYHIIVRPYPYIDTWIKYEPLIHEKLIEIENWT